jgi:subtilisin family serine protease
MRWLWRDVARALVAMLAVLWLLSAGLALADPPVFGDSMAPNPPAAPPPPSSANVIHDSGPPTGADSFKAVEGDDGGGGGGGGNFGSPGGSSGGPSIEIPGQLPTSQQQGPSVSPNEIIVVLPGTLDRSAGAAFAADHNSTVVDYFMLPGLNAHVFLMSVRDAAQFGQRFQKMTQDPRPLWVQSNPAFATSPARKLASTDPKPNIGLQYALTRVHIEPVLDVTRGGGVPVAMVDSGVAVAHEALAGASISVLDVIAKPNAPTTTVTPEVHGTAIASIIVGHGPLQGIAPDVELLAIRAFKETDPKSGAARSSAFYLSKGISAAIDRGARVINLSLSGPQDRLVAHTVEQALMARIAVIAAAGNAGPGAPPAYPAAQAGVIAVTATDDGDRLYRHANRGPYVTLAAPGVDILVAKPPKGYGYLSGTSMATAFVSGLSALMISRVDDLTPVRLRKLLEMSATDLGPPQRDPEFGAGRIDASVAFSHLAAN